MPYLNVGEKLDSGYSQFFKLKEVGDSLRFRVLGIPFVEGKHFFETAEGYDVKPCVRINEHAECQYCQTYFKALATAKKTGDEKEVKKVKESKEMKPYRTSLLVYYPVLDRTEGKFIVFQTGMGIRGKIEAEAALGTKIMDTDFVVKRMAKFGPNTYAFSKVDSSDTTPITLEEEEEVKKGKAVKLEEMINGTADDESNVAVEANVEVE